MTICERQYNSHSNSPGGEFLRQSYVALGTGGTPLVRKERGQNAFVIGTVPSFLLSARNPLQFEISTNLRGQVAGLAAPPRHQIQKSNVSNPRRLGGGRVVASVGAVSCVEYRAMRSREPSKSRAPLFTRGNIRSLLLSSPFARCGRTRLRRTSRRRVVLASDARSSGYQATALHPQQHSWRSWTGLLAGRR